MKHVHLLFLLSTYMTAVYASNADTDEMLKKRDALLITFIENKGQIAHLKNFTPGSMEDCGNVLVNAVKNGKLEEVEQLLRGGCPASAFGAIEEFSKSKLYSTRTDDKLLAVTPLCNATWTALHLCKGTECSAIRAVLRCYRQDTPRIALQISESWIGYPSAQHALYEVGGRSWTKTSYMMLDE